MSAREEIHRLFESGRTSYRLDELLDAYRAEVLREALAAVSGEQLQERTGTPDDEAYMQAIDEAHHAVMALITP